MPITGETICGDVRLEAEASASLGAAPLQPVFLARSGSDAERMWLVAIGTTYLPTSMDVSRFMAGANGLVGLRHPALARVLLVDREDDICVVGYEALPGAVPLADVAPRGVSAPDLARAALETARGLAFLHARGLVHGMLTPGTVVMWEGVPVLMGYGVAALCVPDVLGPRSKTLGGDAVAPEIAAGDPPTARADVFAWGATIAALATAERGLGAVAPILAGEVDVPGAEAILEVVRCALEPDPEDRPGDGTKLLERLSDALAQTPTAGTVPPWMPRGATDHAALRELAARYIRENAAASEPGPGAPPTSRAPADDDDDDLIFALDLEADASPGPAAHDPASRGKRRTPLPNVAPGGATPREPDTPAGWLRASEKAPSTDPSRTPGHHPRWPVAHDLGGGIRKRTFAGQAGSPDATIEDETPRDPLLAGAPPPPTPEPAPEPPPESPSLGAPPPPRPSARHLAERLDPEDEHAHDDAEEEEKEEKDPPTVPAGEATLPSFRGPARAVEPFRPPRMPGPHGPPAVVLAVLLAAIAGGLAVMATVRGVKARGSFSALWDEEAVRTAEIAARAGDLAQRCPDDMVRLPTSEPGDPLAHVCIDVAEHPGWMEAPQTDVTFVDAQRICAQRDRRLCTTEEWRRACGGVQGRTWPWGDADVPRRCRVAPAEGRGVGLSGGAAQCVTPEGVFDMVGNVAEWVAEGTVLGGNIATKNASCATEAPGPESERAARRGKAKRRPVGVRCCVDLR